MTVVVKVKVIEARQTADVTVCNGGSIFLFQLHTDAAREWVKENLPNLEDWQWFGEHQFAVEHRYARDLAAGMAGDGLTVE